MLQVLTILITIVLTAFGLCDSSAAMAGRAFACFFKIKIYIYLAVLALSCGMWDLVP